MADATPTTISCNFRDSLGNALDGYILVGLDSWLMSSGDSKTYTTNQGKVTFASGLATLNLVPSELAKVTYSFEVYYYKSVTTSDPDTGDPVITITDTLLYPKFYAQVPVSLTPILFNDLAKQSGINRDNIDTAISGITRRLYNDDTFWARLQQNLFVAKGTYSATAWYQRGDVVTWDGGSYLYYSVTRTLGTTPSNTAYWQKLADRGATGTGTTGNNAPLDSSWSGATDAPSRNAVYNALQTYALATTVAGLAPLNSPNLTGTPTRASAPPAADNSSQLATTAWVQTIVAAVAKAVNPVGTVMSFAGSSAPTGWVLCDGRTLSQTTYSALYALLGTTYNTGGELASEFRVPDLRGRFIVAPDAMGGVAASRSTGVALANSGGASTVTLTTAQMPLHKHNVSFKGFTATGLADSTGTGFVAMAQGSTAPTVGLTNLAGNRSAANDALGAIQDAGSGSSHNNQPPYLSLNAIIYTGV